MKYRISINRGENIYTLNAQVHLYYGLVCTVKIVNFALKNENKVESIDEINGKEIILGSLEEVSLTGNWPKKYGKNEQRHHYSKS